MEQILKTLQHDNLTEVILFGLLVNTGIYLGSLVLYTILNRFPGSKPIGNEQPLIHSDVLLSLLTVICNTVVFVLGVVMWQNGWIKLAEQQSWMILLIEVLALVMIMDLLMYLFHRSVHVLKYFKIFHERHHEHESTNLLSLFVLHPIESIGFGMMILAVIIIFPFSAIGISIYLTINSIWGTIGHLNRSMLPKSWSNGLKKVQICTSEFHYLHHQSPGYNFGFYSSIWDRIFGTIHPHLKNTKRRIQD